MRPTVAVAAAAGATAAALLEGARKRACCAALVWRRLAAPACARRAYRASPGLRGTGRCLSRLRASRASSASAASRTGPASSPSSAASPSGSAASSAPAAPPRDLRPSTPNSQWCRRAVQSEVGQAAPRMASARFPGEPGTSPPASKQAAPRALKQTSASFSHVPTILEMKMRGCNAREVRQCSTSCAVCCPVSSEGGRGGRAASAGGECSGTAKARRACPSARHTKEQLSNIWTLPRRRPTAWSRS